MRRHERLVLGTALRLLGNLEAAQDASQEVFLKLYRNLGKLATEANASAWLYRVTVNVCRDAGRKRRPMARGGGIGGAGGGRIAGGCGRRPRAPACAGAGLAAALRARADGGGAAGFGRARSRKNLDCSPAPHNFGCQQILRIEWDAIAQGRRRRRTTSSCPASTPVRGRGRTDHFQQRNGQGHRPDRTHLRHPGAHPFPRSAATRRWVAVTTVPGMDNKPAYALRFVTLVLFLG